MPFDQLIKFTQNRLKYLSNETIDTCLGIGLVGGFIGGISLMAYRMHHRSPKEEAKKIIQQNPLQVPISTIMYGTDVATHTLVGAAIGSSYTYSTAIALVVFPEVSVLVGVGYLFLMRDKIKLPFQITFREVNPKDDNKQIENGAIQKLIE